MKEAQPSATALRVAARRAAHQLFDEPKVLDDPLALPILGREAADRLSRSKLGEMSPVSRALRAFMVARARFAEDELARARTRGARQYVILGAGLDTFAYRQPPGGEPFTIFEVDHPATQAWKRQRLAEAGIAVPPTVRYVVSNFEDGTLAKDLAAAGFLAQEPAFFAWLGVTMYLSDPPIDSTLDVVAASPAGGGLVLDYFLPRASLRPFEKLAFDELGRRVAGSGEPFRSFFDPAHIAGRLRSRGFTKLVDLDAAAINARYFQGRRDRLRIRGDGGHILSAER
jgi:methyltransferase (TIGR00027 family)